MGVKSAFARTVARPTYKASDGTIGRLARFPQRRSRSGEIVVSWSSVRRREREQQISPPFCVYPPIRWGTELDIVKPPQVWWRPLHTRQWEGGGGLDNKYHEIVVAAKVLRPMQRRQFTLTFTVANIIWIWKHSAVGSRNLRYACGDGTCCV